MKLCCKCCGAIGIHYEIDEVGEQTEKGECKACDGEGWQKEV